MVLGGAEERAIESADRSLGSRGPKAGAAIHPRDARLAEDLLTAAGRASEAAFKSKRPNVVLSGGSARGNAGAGGEDYYRAAR